jgi:hypothetical protein
MTRSEAARVAALARWGKYTPKPQARPLNIGKPATPTKAPPPRKSRSAGSRGRAAAPKAPKPTAAQRQAERDANATAARRANEAAVGSQAGLGENLHGALMEFASPDEKISLAPQNKAALAKAGLVETGPDGQDRLTAAGRAYAQAARKGDVRAAADAISRGTEAAAKPAKGGGGGGGSATPTDDEKLAAQQKKRTATAAQTAAQVGLGTGQVDALRAAAETGTTPNAQLQALGLTDAAGNTTDQGRRALAALERGDVRGYRAALQDANAAQGRQAAATARTNERRAAGQKRDAERTARQAQIAQRRTEREAASAKRDAERAARRAATDKRRADLDARRQARDAAMVDYARRRSVGERYKAETYGGKQRNTLRGNVFAGPDRSFPIVTAQDVKDAVRSLGRTKHDKATVKRGIIRRARAIGATAALPESWRGKSFAVYKDASGQPRWIARTTTAYKDRDGEILPIATLDQDSQRMTQSGQYGPLRWWHVGAPDPHNDTTPWGIGLDLGMCDYSAQIGRTRLESGTFNSPKIAARVAQIAGSLELSPGFFHKATDPQPDGTYSAIRTFERSIVPTRYGRASNLFTGISLKGNTIMDQDEFNRRFKAACIELKLSPEQSADLYAQMVQTDKTATDQRVAFKSAEQAPAPSTVYYLPDGQPGVIVDNVFVALKAAPSMAVEDEPAPPADDAMTAVEEMDDGEPDAAPGQYAGDMSVDEMRSMMQEIVQATIAPLTKALDMAGKMGGMVDELKSMMTVKAPAQPGQPAAPSMTEADRNKVIADMQAMLATATPATVPQTFTPSNAESDIAAALKSQPENSAVARPANGLQSIAAASFPELYPEYQMQR